MKIFLNAVAALIIIACATAGHAETCRTRTVELRYHVAAERFPPGAKHVAVWVPCPATDDVQQMLEVRLESTEAARLTYDGDFGNPMLYFSPSPAKRFEFAVTYLLRRKEIRLHDAPDRPVLTTGPDGLFARFINPSRFAVMNAGIRKMAEAAAHDKTTTKTKARAVYDWVLANMSYDKSVPGWGRGDVQRLCLAIDSGKTGTGNCTDFHSLFGSMMRGLGIPVVFEMGFPLHPDRSAPHTQTGGYHCWAKFYLPGSGWVPVDISEASKDRSKKDYFFGSLCENRIRFSRGRDILLEPPQAGERLNYFGPDPYIEVDGKPFAAFTRTISYVDK